MKTCIYILLVFVLALGIASGKTDSSKASAIGESSKQKARKYDFFSPENFANDPVQTEEKVDPDYTDDGADVATPNQTDGQYLNSNVYKGYDKPPSFDYYPFFQNYKSFPYYPKGKLGSLEDNGIAFPSEEQIMEMMKIMNNMNHLQVNSKKDEQGFLEKLMADLKTYMLDAIILLAVMISSFVTFVASYFMSGPSIPAVMTTIVNSKMARTVQDIDKVLENLIEFGSKVLEDDDCIQRTICEIALSKGGYDNAKYAAFVINRVSKDDWLENWGAKELVSALEESSCENVCRSVGKKVTSKKHRLLFT